MKIQAIVPAVMLSLILAGCGNKNTPIDPVDPIDPNAPKFTLTVSNGYGSGSFQAGDTVHIWSTAAATAPDMIFDSWSGATELLVATQEWHMQFVMPAKDVLLAANYKTVATYTVQYEQIRGKNNLKNVYSFFPANLRGVVYLLHGTGGSAAYWTNQVENKQLLNDLAANGFGCVITEAEEITTGNDGNGDGKLRWIITPLDSVNNIDLANLKVITDTLIQRGKFTYATPRFALGMSNGGFFAFSLGSLFNYKGIVSYCAQGNGTVAASTPVPVIWCMAQNDNNDGVGQTGNADALGYHQNRLALGLYSQYFVHGRSPVYPERFLRASDIDAARSTAIFNELKNNACLDGKNYIVLSPASIDAAITANAALWPTYTSLNTTQQRFVATQIDAMYAEHQFFSDFNKQTLALLNALSQ